MNLSTKYMTRNDCYTAGRKITPRGIMVHSTATPGVMAEQWFDLWNKSYRAGEINKQACVHAFVDDKSVWQYLPWDHRGWHAGGEANNTHVSFEICEPAGFTYQNNQMTGYNVAAQQPYFDAAWKNAVELCRLLCRQFGLTERNIICHSEGYDRGIASNHGDVMHWFPLHGKSMDSFRRAVKSALEDNMQNTPDNTPSPWAEEAVTWATENQLLLGDEQGNLRLSDKLSREELCLILYRYDRLREA